MFMLSTAATQVSFFAFNLTVMYDHEKMLNNHFQKDTLRWLLSELTSQCSGFVEEEEDEEGGKRKRRRGRKRQGRCGKECGRKKAQKEEKRKEM